MRIESGYFDFILSWKSYPQKNCYYTLGGLNLEWVTLSIWFVKNQPF